MSNDMTKLVDDYPNEPQVAYLAACFAWNAGWAEHNQRLIDALAPIGFVIEGGPTVDISTDSHPSLDPALRDAAENPKGYAVLVDWLREGQRASGGNKNPATYIPTMLKSESGRATLSRMFTQSSAS